MATSILEEQFVEQQPVEAQERQVWRFIDLEKLPTEKAKLVAIRLNSLASLYYFCKVVLRKHRFTEKLHYDMCLNVEKDSLKELIEWPRDHFKSTVHSEGAPMWWALPFSNEDEDFMRILGYDDSYIKWMKRAHDQNTRTLIVSEIIENAIKMGTRISKHYESNDLFRTVFPEIIPDSSCAWNAHSMTHLRTRNVSPQGEGTYDVIGVGGALQSRHYKRIIEDDIQGRKAAYSDVVMEDTINYHKLLVGVFDAEPGRATKDNDEIVVGNRWSWRDLNSYIREEEPYFNVQSHSALGGCCEKHPANTILFPEEFSVEKLSKWKLRLGSYAFSCQFLNNPTPPGDVFFKKEWLRYYEYQTLTLEDKRARIVHDVRQGEVLKDVMPGNLQRSMVIDPNHSGSEGRCRHAVIVTGLQQLPLRIYILDVWAESCSYERLISQIYALAKKWKLKEIWLETVASQKYLKFHLEYRNSLENRNLKVRELKTERAKDSKDRRIESLESLFEQGQIWINKFGHESFEEEYSGFPHAKTKDILDTLGYAPQTWRISRTDEEMLTFMKNHQADQARMHGSSLTGY